MNTDMMTKSNAVVAIYKSHTEAETAAALGIKPAWPLRASISELIIAHREVSR